MISFKDSPTWDEFEQAIVNLDLKFMSKFTF